MTRTDVSVIRITWLGVTRNAEIISFVLRYVTHLEKRAIAVSCMTPPPIAPVRSSEDIQEQRNEREQPHRHRKQGAQHPCTQMQDGFHDSPPKRNTAMPNHMLETYTRAGESSTSGLFQAVSASVAIVSLALVGPVFAGSAEAELRAALERHSRGSVIADSVNATPVQGIFEVVSGRDVFYVDRSGRYAFLDGRLVDMAERRDLTQARIEALERIDFDALPLDAALKTVRGTGARRLAVFEDPACPVCRDLQASLATLDNVTIYTFTYPVIAQESIPAAVSAWCAPDADRMARWKGYMAGAAPPNHIDPGCEQAMDTVQAIVRFGETHGIRNTPTLFLADGRRVVGAMPGIELRQAIEAAARR